VDVEIRREFWLRSRRCPNQERYYDRAVLSFTIEESTDAIRLTAFFVVVIDRPSQLALRALLRSSVQGEANMSGQVVLYFDDQADALRFALVAGSVMAGDGSHSTDDLAQNAARVTRIRLNATNTGKAKQAMSPDRVA